MKVSGSRAKTDLERADGREAKPLEELPISVLLPVKNEEANLATALDSVAWSDDVWVVDSNSSDRTIQIAKDFGAKVVQFEYRGVGLKKKNWALSHLEFLHDWILILDADEVVPASLRAEIAARVFTDELDGYYVNRVYSFMGRDLRSFGANWSLRLFRRKLGRYEMLGTNVPFTGDNEVHEHVLLDGRAGRLHAPLINRDHRPIRAWVDNHNRYSDWEAAVYQDLLQQRPKLGGLLGSDPVTRRRLLKCIWIRLPARPLARFLLFYVVRLGILDGRPGFIYAVLMGYYEFLISLKLRERRLTLSKTEAIRTSRV